MKRYFTAVAMVVVGIVVAVCLAGLVSAEEIPIPIQEPTTTSPENQCTPACTEPQTPAPADVPAPTPPEPQTPPPRDGDVSG
jgi:hypothetical protein